MDATQQIEDSFFGEEDESDDALGEGERHREPLAVLKVFKNNHIPETEVPLYQGENILGRDPTCSSVPLQARSVSGQHAIISISVFDPNSRHAHGEATETLLWDLGSLNGTRKGRVKLTPHVRYALTEGDTLVLADLPCQYVSLKNTERNTHTSTANGGSEKVSPSPISTSSSSEGGAKGVENGGKKSVLPPVPVWTDEAKSVQSLKTTPQKPERTLVPESDSDSDGEKHGRKGKRTLMVSDSASSDLSSPTCSTFLTPANKIIPESEDESSITPSPALKGRVLKTLNDTEVSSEPDPLHFSIDSDTDAEDEEVETTKATTGAKPAAVTADVDAVNPADLHMDSDTDMEEEEMENAKRNPEASAAPAKQDSVHPGALTMDSDTDVEENEPVETDTAPLSGSDSALEEKKEPASPVLLHLDSDINVEDEDVPRIQDFKPPTSHKAEFNMSSDTDVEEDEKITKAVEPPSGSVADSKDLQKMANIQKDSVSVPDVKMLHYPSDSDTDVEDEVTEIRTPMVAKVTGNSQTQVQTVNKQHDSPVQVQSPAETAHDEFRMDSDTDVEEDEENMEVKEQKSGKAVVQIVHSSTPRGAGLSEEEMETQAFLSPSQLFKRPVLPSLLHPSVSPGGVSHKDDDFAVAETQSFVCNAAQADATLDETLQESPESQRLGGASSFPLSLSDSSRQLPEAVEDDRDPTDDDWQLQATQLYAMKNSEGEAKAGQTQQDLDATQAYTDVLGKEGEEDGGKDEEEEETQPLDALGHSSIQTTSCETQLIKHRAQNEDNNDHDVNEETVASEPERKAEDNINDEMQVDSHLSTADTLLIIRSPRQEDQMQPYAYLTAQIQKEQEETVKEKHEGRDQEVQETDEGERVKNENVGQKNDEEMEKEGREKKENERMVLEKKNDVTRGGPKEEKKERDESIRVDNGNIVDDAQTQPAEADTIVETQCEEEEGKDENKNDVSRDGSKEEKKEREENIRENNVNVVDDAQAQPAEADTIVETLPLCEEEEGQEEEQLNEFNSSRVTQPTKVAKESTQPLEPGVDTIAQTLPMCEEDRQEEEQNKPRNSRRPGRRRQTAKLMAKKPVEPDKVTHVTTAESQSACEEDEERQVEEQQSEAVSTRRSGMRRHNAKVQPKTKLVESQFTIPETIPVCEEEEEQKEKSQSETKSGRKSRRGRQTAKTEATQPLELESTEETVKMEEEEEEQDIRRSLRGKERGRVASGKGKGRGRAVTEKQKGKRGKVELKEDSEEKVEERNKGQKKSKDDDKARLELVEAESEEMEHLKKQQKKEETRKESLRMEKEERECEKREQAERLERERVQRNEKEMKEREEMKRSEKKKHLERERREQEEKEKLERENKEKEEKEKRDKEMREKQETKREKDRLEKEMMEEKEKQKKDMEQKEKDKETKDNKEHVEEEKRQAPGKQKIRQGRRGRTSKKEEEQEVEEGTKEGLESEQELSEVQKQEDKQGKTEAKPGRGRRNVRKSVAPPAGVEDEGGPAKRTRSRSSSSNSVSSEQTTQDSLSEVRIRVGRRKTGEEVSAGGRPSGRRRTTTALSSEKENTEQAAHSQSNSVSSDRSGSIVATQSQGRGAKRTKSMKVEKPEQEGEQSATVGRGRGRGRGGKHPGAKNIKAEAEKEEALVMAVSEDSVTSQSSSRGRKRGADNSLLSAESQLTPKISRRSLAGQIHKVLFTGVVDEDGEKVVVRLGGGLAKGVGDMTHLVTDKVRRTVKFLCAVARGVPIVTPDWLNKCGKAGSFLSPNGFLVKDIEQEKRFNFSLQDALRVASSQPLLQGYEIHVTPSVKPEPAQMKEIITCCGARFLPRMPSAHKAQTVVVSCEEDRALCERARSLSLTLVSAEFLLTGILQQKVDIQKHALSLSPAAAGPKPAARTRGK